ncbi:glycosyltransferase family 2 protein [Caulobacter endophyticus]|uniref:glycosyltransferase family 2 protein n=1 Tax=Caulobacter endophyticus TaxID=2172652 RepID=UPI002410405B|nr:glycosyltransferase family A protein [Caulobacter endophyticus]MDG2528266.1 glycosyltransferase family A protein [Caulobacter endophyticus]
MAELKVAVVIPFFNGAAFISEALAMLAAQTRRPDQIIIVDDGSSADDAKVLAECAAAYGATVLAQANQGPGVARNLGVAAADAQLIAFLDVDDVWDDDKLEKQVACFLADQGLDLVLCESRTARPDGGIDHVSTLAKLERDRFVDLILKGRIHSFTSSMLFKRSFFQRLGGFEPELRFREDHLLLMRSLLEGRVHILAAPLSTRRLHPNSMSGAGANPDLTLRLQRAELFWTYAGRFVPRLPKRSLLAFEMQRLAKNYIVAGRPTAAIAAAVHAFLLEPTRPKRLAYAGAAVWSCVQPGRFDHWHSGLASMRKLRTRR